MNIPNTEQNYKHTEQNYKHTEQNIKYIDKQPSLNIGTIGHVAHGKSTLVKKISLSDPIKFKSELERNITIKLGYANAKIYECNSCKRPDKFQIYASCKIHDSPNKLIKHVSFIDCPGHDVLMATMLSGTSIMDAAVLLIAANEPVPQPQTVEHLFALELISQHKNFNENMIIVQNKVDLVNKNDCLENKENIKKFTKNTIAEEAPIIPTAMQKSINLSAILDYIVHLPEKKLERVPGQMVIIRSFDINKPKQLKTLKDIEEIKGGVIGGSILNGFLKKGEIIEIRPGNIKKDGKKDISCKMCKDKTNFVCEPFFTEIISLKSESTSLEEAHSGGLIAIQTDLDPFYCKSDKLLGQHVGKNLPPVFDKILIKHKLLEKITSKFFIEKIKLNEHLLLNIGSQSVNAKVTQNCGCLKETDMLENEDLFFDLMLPVCAEKGDKIAISRKIKGHWRLIGFGEIKNGVEVILN